MFLKEKVIMKFLLVICLCFGQGLFAESKPTKKAYIITGPESSGSAFISRVIAYVVGKDSQYRQWSGFGLNGKIEDSTVILHRSQPTGLLEQKFTTKQEFHDMFPDYQLYFIITTRDQTIQNLSAERRFNRTPELLQTAQKIVADLLATENCFIWSYETQQFLKQAYFLQLYKFLEIKSDFYPYDLKDANKPYIRGR